MIDQTTIDKIFSAADIVEVIGDFVKLKKTGANYKGLSPFTDEKTPSFFISPAKGIFKCFSSGIGGNVVSFLMEHEKLSYPEALRYLAKKYNIEIVEKELSEEEKKEKNERESLLSVSEFALKQFNEWLFHREEGKAIGLAYFKERGFRENIIEKFQLGYSPEQRDAFTKLAIEKGYKLDYLVKTGLTIDKGDYRFDRFAGRIIFPIHSISGQPVGFGGRILKKADKAAKYINSPESEIYHKSHILYGLFFAKKEIIRQDKCFLVEGYTDVISLHQEGIENVVSSSGTALTKEQVRLIKRFTKNVTVLYDGDEAGIKASIRGIDIILEEGLNVKVLLLPEGEDPDSFSRSHGNEEFLNFITENESDFIKFKTRLLLKDAENDPVKKATLITDVVRSISVIPDNIARSVYIRECSKILEIDEGILYNETFRLRRNKAYEQSKRPEYKPPNKIQPQEEVKISNEYPHEKDLLRILLRFSDKELRLENDHIIPVLDYVIDELKNDELEFHHPVYRMIYDEIVHKYNARENFTDHSFTHHENPDICKVAVDLTTDNYELSAIWRKKEVLHQGDEMKLKEIVPEFVMAFKNKKVTDLIKDTQKDIRKAQDNADEENMVLLQQKLMVLNDLRKRLAKKLGDRTII
ncbi:MAG: DNA primase [Bacteroidales bacterium]|jgi:DNA primase